MHLLHHQIQKEFIATNLKINLKVLGISNSKKMLVSESEIDLDNWKTLLANSNISSDSDVFQKTILDLNLRNSLFVDNTASNLIPNTYREYLKNGVGIITFNKIANSDTFINYEELGRALKTTFLEAKLFQSTNINTAHLLLCILRNDNDPITKVLSKMDISYDNVKEKFKSMISDTGSDDIIEYPTSDAFPDEKDDSEESSKNPFTQGLRFDHLILNFLTYQMLLLQVQNLP